MYTVTTDTQINTLQAASRAKSYWAGPDLVLVVTSDSKKLFRIYSTKYVLGHWPSINLELARVLARRYTAKVVQQERKKKREARKTVETMKFTALTHRELDDVPWVEYSEG